MDGSALAVRIVTALLVLGFIIALIASPSTNPRKECRVCTRCGTNVAPTYYRSGSYLFGILLLLFFVLPGILYLTWHSTRSYWGCAKCGAREIIPLDSPVARKITS